MTAIPETEPGTQTIEQVADALYGEGEDGMNHSHLTPPSEMERTCREVVRLATPFDVVSLGVLEARLLSDSYRQFSRRGLKAMVRGIVQAIRDYQKAARAEARRAKKAQRS